MNIILAQKNSKVTNMLPYITHYVFSSHSTNTFILYLYYSFIHSMNISVCLHVPAIMI